MTNWKKREKKIIQKYGGKPTPASGAKWWNKADGRIGSEWRVEVKGTNKEEFKVTKGILSKLLKDSTSSGGTPMLIVDFKKFNRQVVVTPDYTVKGEALDQGGPTTVEPYSHGYIFEQDDRRWAVLSGELARHMFGLA